MAHDGADAEARSCLAWILWRRGNYDAALAEVARALAMAPNLALAQGVRGAALTYSGRPTEGLPHLESCIRLDPQGYVFVGHRVQKFEFPDCANNA